MAKIARDLRFVGTRKDNAETIRQLGLEGLFSARGHVDVRNIEVVNLTPKLAALVATKTAKLLAGQLDKRKKSHTKRQRW